MSVELFVSRHQGRMWAALREHGSTVELRVDRRADEIGEGRILKARVSNLLPGLQAAFVELPGEQGAFLHSEDLILPGDSDPPAPIQDRLKPGRELVVQVLRSARGAKRARVGTRIQLPGRLLVLLTGSVQRGVARRIRDAGERRRLGEIIARLPGRGVGFLARTAAAGVEEERLRAEARWLVEEWSAVRDAASLAAAPATVRREADLLTELLRDAPGSGVEQIVVDDPELRQRAIDYLDTVDAQLCSRIRLYAGDGSAFDSNGIDVEIERALRPKVWLRSGGYLVVESTEALVSIDVNTGKSLGKRDPEKTILQTNLEAAREIPRQLRLRNLSGIIIVDWVDMRRTTSWQTVMTELEERLQQDPVRTRVVDLSEIGVLQMTRQRTRPPLLEQASKRCSTCGGSGRVAEP